MRAEIEAFRRRRRSTFYPKTDAPLPDDLLRSLRSSAPGAGERESVAEACRRVSAQRPDSVSLLDNQGTFHRLYRTCLPNGHSLIVRVSLLSHIERDFPLLLD